MREYLAALVWRRHRFVATVGERGTSPAGPTVVLREVACAATGQPLAEHVWVRLPRPRVLAQVSLGERIAFRATVRPYRREDGTEDWHLTGLRHVAVVGNERHGRGDGDGL